MQKQTCKKKGCGKALQMRTKAYVMGGVEVFMACPDAKLGQLDSMSEHTARYIGPKDPRKK